MYNMCTQLHVVLKKTLNLFDRGTDLSRFSALYSAAPHRYINDVHITL